MALERQLKQVVLLEVLDKAGVDAQLLFGSDGIDRHLDYLVADHAEKLRLVLIVSIEVCASLYVNDEAVPELRMCWMSRTCSIICVLFT